MAKQAETMERIVALCKRRGFIFSSSEIYGGIGGFWDYGPLGTELKRNVKDVWWNDMVRNPPPGPDGTTYQMVGLDCSIIMNPKVWEASGHVGGFSDPMVDCKECKKRYRADAVGFITVFNQGAVLNESDVVDQGCAPQVKGEAPLACLGFEQGIGGMVKLVTEAVRSFARKHNIKQLKEFHHHGADKPLDGNRFYFRGRKGGGEEYEIPEEHDFECIIEASMDANYAKELRPCPMCHAPNSLTDAREFNLMFESHAGAVRDDASKVYLRPETAQGIFVNFKNVLDSTRVRLPFGIAQIGKSFRNEINPRNYTFRSREFEQYEIEFFCHESQAETWYEYWRDLRHQWYVGLGLKSEKLRLREHEADELAHYARSCADVEYDFPFGLSELEGIANRTDFDLKAHIEKSGKDLSYFDDQRKERYVPYVIEPSGGVDRSVLAFITEAYTVDEKRASPEFMKFHPRLAPIKAAVFPLVAKDGMPDLAEPIHREIKKHFPCQYDAKQSIGKRYARMDEAGTSFCFTIDGQTKEDGTVTVRNRDDASQIRIDKSRCAQYLHDHLSL